MLEKPDISDGRIIATLASDYGLVIASLTFLPLGADVNTAVYRTNATDGAAYFVKLRRGELFEPAVAVPSLLAAIPGTSVIPPIVTLSGDMSSVVDDFIVILYPFVEGADGFNRPLTDSQWADLGATLRQLHSLELPSNLRDQLPLEDFNEHWRTEVRRFMRMVDEVQFDEPSASALAAIMRAQHHAIDHVVSRAEQLADGLATREYQLVPCHGDIHAGNVLIDQTGKLYVVDWDTLCMAPRERDLMFVGAGIGDAWNTKQESELFFDGYGPVQVESEVVAYYRYERIVQDIAEFCAQLLLTTDGGDDRPQALNYFKSQFAPNGVINLALASDPGGSVSSG